MPYVIMLAIAKHVSEGSTGIVFIANTCPGLLVKLSSPYWFDRVSYRQRLQAASLCMAVAFFWMAVQEGQLLGQLCGVALVSLQIGMGEASLLALAGKYDKKAETRRRPTDTSNTSSNNKRCLLGFATGTGLAGPMGFLWKIALTEWFGWTIPHMLLLGIVLAVFYWVLFVAALYLGDHVDADDVTSSHGHMPVGNSEDSEEEEAEERPAHYEEVTSPVDDNEQEMMPIARTVAHALDDNQEQTTSSPAADQRRISSGSSSVLDLSFRERFRLVVSLWPYIVPLFSVYAAEYACQAGAWTAIGFPTVHSLQGRARFYETANWLYQIGTFLARSSGGYFSVKLRMLWLMPALQVVNLVGFSIIAARHGILYHQAFLLGGSFYTGLLGGAVYVHGYKCIISDVPQPYTEFALSTTSAAEAVGVLVADIIGLFLQSCLYSWNGINAAEGVESLVSCPFR